MRSELCSRRGNEAALPAATIRTSSHFSAYAAAARAFISDLDLRHCFVIGHPSFVIALMLLWCLVTGV